jgi:hypothetical protein
MSKVLGELAEDVAVDLRAGLGHFYGQFNFLRDDGGRSKANPDQSETYKKGAHGKRRSSDHNSEWEDDAATKERVIDV